MVTKKLVKTKSTSNDEKSKKEIEQAKVALKRAKKDIIDAEKATTVAEKDVMKAAKISKGDKKTALTKAVLNLEKAVYTAGESCQATEEADSKISSI